MKLKIRKELQIGVEILILYIIFKMFFTPGELMMWILPTASIVFIILGILPEDIGHRLKRFVHVLIHG